MDPSLLPPPSHDPARQAKIDHAGRIDKVSFEVSVSVLFAAAIFSVLVRFAIRLVGRRKLSLDDYLVLIGAVALSAANGVLFHYLDTLYIVEAMNDDGIIPNSAEIGPVLDMMRWNDVFVAMSWTSIFSIKFAFMAFFHPLIWQLSKKITVYFWAVVAFITCCWLLLSLDDFIICPYFGTNASKCDADFKHDTSIAINAVGATLDIVCDIMVITIPVIVLSKSRMRTAQKFGLAAILCLSIVMIVVALIRLIGSVADTRRSNKGTSPVWGTFWEIMEACIAVIMASVIVIRSVFVKNSLPDTRPTGSNMMYRLRQRLLSSLKPLRRSRKREGSDESGPVIDHDRPAIPSLAITRGTLKGLKTFIRGDRRGVKELASVDTTYDLEEADYHKVRREEAKEAGGGAQNP
ncbi:hypothetical protein AOQ84DRAFT_294085 [Glonium stellatum]|uniref:Rhodopsin domain-containing protein n=1 Tax=Glonium stellatum TaxID=574774 RepID=A0A8E2JSM0_9PEZI|nr:hypothetical protein AOQ84DRAFT_294085 [Glonium stellatum]